MLNSSHVVRKSYLQSRRHRRCGFDPWVRKISWKRKWQPTPVVLPGEFQTQRSLTGYSPWTIACKSPLSMGLSQQEYWSGLTFPPPGDLPDPGIEPTSPAILHCQWVLYYEPPGKPPLICAQLELGDIGSLKLCMVSL